jgi:hypothetical protein
MNALPGSLCLLKGAIFGVDPLKPLASAAVGDTPGSLCFSNSALPVQPQALAALRRRESLMRIGPTPVQAVVVNPTLHDPALAQGQTRRAFRALNP